MSWATLESKTNFENRNLTVVTEEVRTPTRVKKWTTVQRKTAVVVAAITAEKKIVLVRQERVPIRAAIWEMPAGQIDEKKFDEKMAAQTALRELREESGYELAKEGELRRLGHFFSSPGLTDERELLYLARPVQLSAEGAAHQEDEGILDCREFSFAELAKLIADGAIVDVNTLAGWAHLRARNLID